jgi:acetyl-CoA C-acetyltransferase
LGGLASVPAPELGARTLKAALDELGLAPSRVNEVYVGNVLSANLGQAPATQVALNAGLPNTTPATMINKVCASGTKSIMVGSMSIRLAEADIVVGGGMENMSQAPHYLLNSRNGTKYGDITMLDAINRDGLRDVYSGELMGEAGELCAEHFGFTREDQDNYAIESYKRAHQANESGVFKDDIVPITIKSRKGEQVVDKDEDPGKTDFDKIPKLKPAFRREGTITAANAPGLNDGAAMTVLASEQAVKQHNFKPLARVVAWADAARDPMWFTMAPSDALPKALERANLSIGDIDLFEINEAFSVVAMANQKQLDIAPEKLNVLGGAVAMGHPIGCSGARIVGSLITGLKQQNKKYGAVGICNGGGGASALVVENLQ